MKASLGRIWNPQLVIRHAVAAAKQHPTLASDEYGTSEGSGLNEGLEISLHTIRNLTGSQVLTAPNTAKQKHTYDSASATERFHSRPSGSIEDEPTG